MEISGTNIDQWGGGLDEVFADDCSVHLERMSDHGFCLILDENATGRRLIINLGTKRAYLGAFVFTDETEVIVPAAKQGS